MLHVEDASRILPPTVSIDTLNSPFPALAGVWGTGVWVDCMSGICLSKARVRGGGQVVEQSGPRDARV